MDPPSQADYEAMMQRNSVLERLLSEERANVDMVVSLVEELTRELETCKRALSRIV